MPQPDWPRHRRAPNAQRAVDAFVERLGHEVYVNTLPAHLLTLVEPLWRPLRRASDGADDVAPAGDPAEATSGLRSACASFRHRGTRPAGVSPTPRFAHHRLGRLSIGGPEVWDLPRGQRGRLVEAPNAPRWQWGSPKAGSDFRENVLGNRAPRAYNAHCPANKRAGLRPARGAAEAPSSHQLPGGRSAGPGEPRVGDTAVWELRQLPARPCGPGRVNRHLSPSCKRTTQSVGRMCPAISPACGEATAASWG